MNEEQNKQTEEQLLELHLDDCYNNKLFTGTYVTDRLESHLNDLQEMIDFFRNKLSKTDMNDGYKRSMLIMELHDDLYYTAGDISTLDAWVQERASLYVKAPYIEHLRD